MLDITNFMHSNFDKKELDLALVPANFELVLSKLEALVIRKCLCCSGLIFQLARRRKLVQCSVHLANFVVLLKKALDDKFLNDVTLFICNGNSV